VAEDKDHVLLKVIGESSHILIIVNTLEQAMRLISLSGIQLKKSRTRFRYAFNEISITDNSGVDIIINPNIDKIDFRRYNKIILYDMFFSAGDFCRFAGKSAVDRTIALYEAGDESSNQEVLSNIIPTRETLVILYKLFNNSSCKNIYTLSQINEALGQIIKAPNRAIIKLSLDILAEAKLIEYTVQESSYEIKTMKSEGKVCLEELISYKEGQRVIQTFREFNNEMQQMYIRRK
jgi:single-stranded-DNA-specific exonuclease